MYNIAIVGVTGAVGVKMLEVLNTRNFPIKELRIFASEKSKGKKISFRNEEYVVDIIQEDSFNNTHFVFCSADSSISKKIGPLVRKANSILIDDGNAFRMEENVPLVVPEVNEEDVDWHQGIVSIPNCTTTPLVMILHALNKYAQIQRVNVSTYQAVSGAGAQAVQELLEQTEQLVQHKQITPSIFSEQIIMNVIPQVDDFESNGYTKEEMKIVNETRKILHLDNLSVSATCTRVPTMVGHCESVLVDFDQEVDIEEVIKIISKQEGVVCRDFDNINNYPTPLNSTLDENVYIGRIRKDLSNKNSILFWLVSDNLLKGAATNAVQIAESIIKRNKLDY
ncbi:MAG: aspartate-semialdehyde dehydrogenase [Chloroflexi bacterium]|nr:aspartate-semialdehyde dehydrogenase [Chloroflexota bacterium]|tara:strand:- start:1629 stop:2642 length:1014 start_codon:yes stop_codon:yes gene_type:complete